MVQLVGILNITPDSFSDGGQFLETEAAISQARQLFAAGATFIDVGAESTNPWSKPLAWEVEWRRLQPVLQALCREFPGKLSIDTYHPETAEKALQLGDVIINDVTGMRNPGMVQLVVRHHARCIISHLPGADIQIAHRDAPVTTVDQVRTDLLACVDLLQGKGLPRANIILDPGIGFGKTMALNTQLLSFARNVPEWPVMIGYSRKRFLGESRMELKPNLEAGRVAIAAGTAYLRVHDVLGHRQLL